MSIKTRIIITFTLLTALLVAVMSRVGYVSVREIYLNQLAEQTNLLVRLIANNLESRYLTFLDGGSPANLAYSYYAEQVDIQAEAMLLKNVFIFDDDLQVLVQSTQQTAIGNSDPRLLLNRSEIRALPVGESATSLPFRGRDGQWYLWGFYHLAEQHWLGIQESADRLAKVESLSQLFWGIGLAGVLLTVFFGWLLARTIAKPIERLVDFSEQLGRGDFSAPIPEGSKGELRILAEALDKMRRDLARQHQEKETMLAQIAHEIRNPLGGIELLAGLVKEDLRRSGSSTEYVEKILGEISGLKSLITAYLNYSRPTPARPEWVNLPELAAEVETMFQHKLRQKEISLEYPGEPLEIWFDRHHLRQILINLVSNSLEMTGEGGHIRITAQQLRRRLEIRLRDDGPGIPPEHRDSVFEPFFTTRANGTGLGLAICKKLCAENQASIRIQNAGQEGCEILISKPLAKQPRSPEGRKGG